MHTVASSACKIMGQTSEQGVEDMIQLQDLHEGSLLYNLAIRFRAQKIYTFTGSILVAVNPYQAFDMYGVEVVRRYEGQVLGTLSPHIFAIASATFSSMQKDHRDQCVVISGESGAGKTESTKLIMRYLAAVNQDRSMISEQILEANPLLESFGNAKTGRNHNSSRFGKYTELHYNATGQISGCSIKEYLLEKSRIVNQPEGERNYHIFYELLVGLPEEQKKKLALTRAEDYFYLNQGGCYTIDVKDDVEDFNTLSRAMEVLGFRPIEQESIFRVLAAVIHLGNVTFSTKQQDGMEAAVLNPASPVPVTGGLLGVSAAELSECLVNKSQITRGEKIVSPLSMEQALDARDALSKALYSNMFNWLVTRVNMIIDKKSKQHSIGILDIFGFEDFKKNSFEQLCINFANENLQFYFNQHIFKLEQEEYERERINWSKIDFSDNQPCLDLICKRPLGIFHILDDESNFPRGTDDGFCQKVTSQHKAHGYFLCPKTRAPQFGVRHYAGSVWYDVTGFLEKNRDTLREELADLVKSSSAKFISELLESISASVGRAAGQGKAAAGGRKKVTVASVFNDSLSSLISTMSKCAPYFVRCIKPNEEKRAGLFTNQMVLDQLRYSGMLETIRIRRAGYPVRVAFDLFAFRFRALLQGRASGNDTKKTCTAILATLPPQEKEGWQLGATKVFVRESTERTLEEQRVSAVALLAVVIQKRVRGWLCLQNYRRTRAAILRIQAQMRMWLVRIHYRRKLAAITRMQAFARMIKPRKIYLVMRAEHRRQRELEREQMKEAGLRTVGDVSSVPVPPELAEMMAKLSYAYHPPYADDSVIIEVPEGLWRSTEIPLPDIPREVAGHDFSKFVSGFFQQGSQWAFSKGPLSQTLLKAKAGTEEKSLLALFNVVLRFMGDPAVADQAENVMGNYIVQRGIFDENCRDELYCMLCNQTWLNPNDINAERGWLLMAMCLSAFPPSHKLYPYLLCYVTQHGLENYKGYCQRKLLMAFGRQARSWAPCMLEWTAARDTSSMAMEVRAADGVSKYIPVASALTAQEAGNLVAVSRGIEGATGWTVAVLNAVGNCLLVYRENKDQGLKGT